MPEDEMVGLYHQLDGHEFEEAPEASSWHASVQGVAKCRRQLILN